MPHFSCVHIFDIKVLVIKTVDYVIDNYVFIRIHLFHEESRHEIRAIVIRRHNRIKIHKIVVLLIVFWKV